MKVHSITLGLVESSQVEELLRAEAHKLGLSELRTMRERLTTAIESASSDQPVDLADERELEEVEFMLTEFLDADGYVKEDIEF